MITQAQLDALISSEITTNGHNAITGAILDSVLTQMVGATFQTLSLLITRQQIPTISLIVNTFNVSGYSTAGDLGAGATYTSQGATSGGPGAIQDASGTWFNLVVNGPLNVGWFGANPALPDNTAAFAACYSACNSAGVGMSIPAAMFKVNSLVWDKPVNIYGAGPYQTVFQPTGNNQTVITCNRISPVERAHTRITEGFSVNAGSATGIIGVHFYESLNEVFSSISAANCVTGMLYEGGQFSLLNDLTCEANSSVGFRLVDDRTGGGGGGNNNQLNNLECYDNGQVGLMCGRTGMPYPFGNNTFVNLVCQTSGVCEFWSMGQTATIVTGLSPEATGTPGGSVTVDGETVTNCTVESITSNIGFAGYNHVSNSLSILAQTSSFLTFSNSSGADVSAIADSTSTIEWNGTCGNGSKITNGVFRLFDTASYAIISAINPSSIIDDQSFPNTCPTPCYPPGQVTSNCSSYGNDTDVNLGMVTTATFNSSPGSTTVNQLTLITDDTVYPIAANIFISVLLKSSITGGFGIEAAQTLLGTTLQLTAGVWTRVFMKNFNNIGSTRGNTLQLFPTDSNGATVQVAKLISCVNLTAMQAIMLSEAHRFNPRDKQGCRALFASAPNFGTWKQNDLCWNNNASASGNIGWVCTVAGSPGTWKTWGAIGS